MYAFPAGEFQFSFKGHTAHVERVAFSPNGKFAVSTAHDATTRIWDLARRCEVARMSRFEDNGWVCLTPEGYYNASENGQQYLGKRRGNAIEPIDNRTHDRYFRPDLVRKALEPFYS